MRCLLDDHNTIMVTWANFHYQDFVMNWVEHVKEVGVKSYLVGPYVATLMLSKSHRTVRAW